MSRVIEIPLPKGGGEQVPEKIIVHAMSEWIRPDASLRRRLGGSRGDVHATELLRGLGLSAHAFITPAGDLIESRSENRVAWHASGHNRNSLGVEVLVPGLHSYSEFLEAIARSAWCTEEAFSATVQLVKGWRTKYAIPMDNVLRHSDVSPGKKFDPGAGFDWPRFQALISG